MIYLIIPLLCKLLGESGIFKCCLKGNDEFYKHKEQSIDDKEERIQNLGETEGYEEDVESVFVEVISSLSLYMCIYICIRRSDSSCCVCFSN